MLSEIERDPFKTRFLQVTSDSSVNEQLAVGQNQCCQFPFAELFAGPFVSGPAGSRFKDDPDPTLALPFMHHQ